MYTIAVGSEHFISDPETFKAKKGANNSTAGLYLLGEVGVEEAEVKSFELLGRISSQSQEVGVLLIVLRNQKGKIGVKSILQAAINSSEGIVHIETSKFNAQRRKLTKGDFIALFLPIDQNNNSIQIATKSQSKGNFKFLSGSKNMSKPWQKLKNQTPEVKRYLNNANWSKWKDLDGDLNVRVIIKPSKYSMCYQNPGLCTVLLTKRIYC